jgi:hypothetical protein
MANIKISDLTAAAAATGTQQFEVNDSLTSKKVTGAQVLAYVESNLTIQNNAVTTAKIADNNVTLAKLQDIATASILGRNTASTGDPEVLTGAQARAIVGADNASNLTTGTVGTARLASGTADSTTFLRGDQTWSTVGSYAGISSQLFTSSGTFTVPTGITKVKITVVGGGGGGGGCVSSGCGETSGSLGGQGGISIAYVTGLTPGGTISVTVGSGGSGGGSGGGTGGTGGTSSAASYASATGGTGGRYNQTGGTGTQGVGSLGRFNLEGIRNTNQALYGYTPTTAVNNNGSTGSGYGASGGVGYSNGGGNKSGGAGAPGMVMVEW